MFGLNYLYNKSYDLAFWIYSHIRPSSSKTTQKTETVAQAAIKTGLLTRFTNWISSFFFEKPEQTDSKIVRRNSHSDHSPVTTEGIATDESRNDQVLSLKKEYDEIMKSGESQNTNELPDRVDQFLKTYTFEDDPLCYTKIHEIYAKITQSQETIPANMTNSQIVMPNMGDCLFLSLIYAYIQALHPSEKAPSYNALPIQHIRKHLVDYEKKHYKNDAELKRYIDFGISDIKQKKNKEFNDTIDNMKQYGDEWVKQAQKEKSEFAKITDEQHFNNYFKNMVLPRMWGGDAELYAFSKIFNVKINIIADHPVKPFNGQAKRSITLRFVQGNHYNVQRTH